MVEKMKLVQVHGMVNHLNEFLEACCMSGEFDPEPAAQYMSASLGYAALNEENPYPAIQARIEALAKAVGMELPEGEGVHNPAPDAETRAYLDALDKQFDSLRDERDALLSQKQMCEDASDQYSHFLTLKANVDELASCTHVKVRFGFLPLPGYNKLMSTYADDPYILFVPCTQEKAGYWGVYLTPRSKAQETDGIFSMLFFEPLHVPGAAGTPAEIVEHFKENLEVLQKSLDDVNGRIRTLWEQNAEKVDQLYNTIRYLSAAFALRHFAAAKGQHFFFVGWVPATSIEDVTARAQAVPSIKLTVDDPGNAGLHTPPTKLKNSWWSRPFEFFVEMYGLPSYGETDITTFVAITFTVLFGIMFGDVGQGAVLAIVSFLLWKFQKNPLFHLMIPCGISSCIFGFVFGSVFGFENALDPLYHALGMAGKPVDIMESINSILLVAVYIGVVLVLASMVLNIYSFGKRGQWGNALFDTSGVVGIFTYTAGVSLCSAFMGGRVWLPGTLAVVLLVVGLVLLLLQGVLIPMFNGESWKPAEGWGNYLMQSVFELIESVLSYLSNTISFLRVGAFVIVHASMMMVVFALAGTPANLVVVVLGNVVVICLEALLSGIQGIRLEFYEMFSRCYVGGGRKYEALDIRKKPHKAS
ncbi:MAG: V-type ATPase 116kDa subunit family protein [Gemmiger sp.]|nr:V-type ATPase 116kDa subunit family protein [Gemmiger sp.]